jgi:hypothetical protein
VRSWILSEIAGIINRQNDPKVHPCSLGKCQNRSRSGTAPNSGQVLRACGPSGFAKRTTLWYASPVRGTLNAMQLFLGVLGIGVVRSCYAFIADRHFHNGKVI